MSIVILSLSLTHSLYFLSSSKFGIFLFCPNFCIFVGICHCHEYDNCAMVMGGGEVFLKKYPADLSAMFTHTKCLLDFLCCLPLNISPSDGSFHLNNPLPLLLLV